MRFQKNFSSIQNNKFFLIDVINFLILFSILTYRIIYSIRIFIIHLRRKFLGFNSNKINIGFNERNNVFNYLILTFHDFHIIGLLLFIFIGVFLFGIIIFIIKESRKKFNHDSTIESWWIFFPSLILGSIAIPSISILYSLEDIIIIVNNSFKAIGHQWFWTYDLISTPKKNFNQNFIERYITENEEEEIRLLSREGELYLPAFKHSRGLIRSKDVIHRWALPVISIKTDAIPGRLNQVEFITDETNITLYGQCSELCGVNHRFIPIILQIL